MTHRVYQNPNNTWQSLYGWFALYDCFLIFLFCCEMYNQATTRVSYCPNMAFVIVWIPDKTYAKILTAALLVNWRRPPGRPRTTWMKTIQQDLKSNNLSLNEAINMAQNRPLWRLMSMFDTTHPSGAFQKWCCLMFDYGKFCIVVNIILLSFYVCSNLLMLFSNIFRSLLFSSVLLLIY